MDGQTDRQTDRRTDRQRSRLTNGRTDRQMSKQTDRQYGDRNFELTVTFSLLPHRYIISLIIHHCIQFQDATVTVTVPTASTTRPSIVSASVSIETTSTEEAESARTVVATRRATTANDVHTATTALRT